MCLILTLAPSYLPLSFPHTGFSINVLPNNILTCKHVASDSDFGHLILRKVYNKEVANVFKSALLIP